MKKLLAAAVIALMIPFALHAQTELEMEVESEAKPIPEIQPELDSIFEEPQEDIVIEVPNDIDYRSQFEQSDKVTVKGHFLVRGGAGVGWDELPPDSEPEKVAGAYSKATVSFDIRPDSTIRIFGKLMTELDSEEGSDTWSMLEADELYCDYNWLDKAYLRLGKFYMTWGHGRLFRPADFMDDCEDGTAFRMSLPNMLDGVSLVSLYQKRPHPGKEDKLHSDEISFAGLADKTFGSVNFTLSGLYNEADGEKVMGGVKTVILGTDLFSDYVLTHNDLDEYTHEALFGFYKEFGEDYKLYGEYYYDGRIEDDPDHCLGMATNWNNMFGTPVSLGLKWLHSVESESGQFIGGLSVSPWKHVKINLAVPWNYGHKELDDDFYDDFPIDSKLAFTLFVEISSSF